MRFLKVFFLFLFFDCCLLGSGAYLWESHVAGQRSCCLFLNGNDICNPNVACTRNVALDLRGIFDYLGRIVQADKGATFSYSKILDQAQEFIKNILSTGAVLYYHFDTPQRRVTFLHTLAETARTTEKNSKNSSSSVSNAAAEKQKNEDAVLAYLIQLGLAWKRN